MGNSASSPNEHLYSSLYGREMELMRKMFKANEKIDPQDVGNGNYASALRSGNANGASFGPSYTSPIFGGNASKYFEGLNSNEQPTKFGGGLRSDLFEHNVHNNSNTGLSPTIKSQAALMGDKHFGMHFANNHNNNNNVMNPNQNLIDPSLSNGNSNNNNMVLHNLKSFSGSFANANLTSPTSSENGNVSSNQHSNHGSGVLEGSQMHFGGHNMHTGSFHGSPGNMEKVCSNKLAEFESTRKTGDETKSLTKMGAKLDEHFLDDELKARLSQQLAASLLNSPHHHQSPGNLNNGASNNNHNLSNDDEDDDEFTSL